MHINRLFEKIGILLVCLMGLIYSAQNITLIIAALIAVTVSSLAQVWAGRKAAWVLIACCAALCGIMPEMLNMMPLLMYDALWEKKPILLLPAAAFMIHPLNISRICFAVVGFAVAIIMFSRVSKLEKKVDTLQQMRDDAAENNLALRDRNEAITLAQDSEIHIATLKERNRIAREIHDNVGHMLTRSLLQAGALIVINKDEDMKEPLESLKNTLDTAMTSIRSSVHDLYDDSIDLEKSIKDSISTVDERFEVKLDMDTDSDMPGRIKLCILGVIKESLSNAVKHSNGDKIFISVQEHPAFYRLLIQDNGSCTKISQTGIGLENMQERARSAGGVINFTPSPEGFRIFMTIPKKNNAD